MVTSGFMSCYRLQWQEEEMIEEGLHCLATKLVIKSNKKKHLLFCFLHLCVFSVVNTDVNWVHSPSIKHGPNHPLAGESVAVNSALDAGMMSVSDWGPFLIENGMPSVTNFFLWFVPHNNGFLMRWVSALAGEHLCNVMHIHKTNGNAGWQLADARNEDKIISHHHAHFCQIFPHVFSFKAFR